jgi:hypothetical protein
LQIAEKTNEVRGQREEVGELRKTVAKLEEKVEDSDAYERRDTLVISGPGMLPATAAEICSALVCSIVREKLKINLLPTNISTVHRLGRKPLNQQPDTRNIIMKLCRRDVKRDLLFACRQLKPDIYIKESLTPSRNTILDVLRKIKAAHPGKVHGCSYMDGRVYALMKTPDTDADNILDNTRRSKVFINSYSKLVEFCNTNIKRIGPISLLYFSG